MGDQLKNICSKYWSIRNLKAKFPIHTWAPKYRLKYLQHDMIAGFTVGLTVIPQGLAYAKIAELPAQYGLYSAFMGCFVYTFLGTSKDITLGPTAIMSLMTADFAHNPVQHDPTYAILLTLMCGIVQFVMGLLKLGFLVNFISFPVINGFTSAAAITIAFSQIKTVLGLHDVRRDFLHCVYDTFSKVPETNVWDLVMGLICMAVLIILKQVKELKYNDDDGEPSMKVKVARKILWLFGTARNAIVVIFAGLVTFVLETQDVKKLSITGDLKAGLPEFKVPAFTMYDPDLNKTLDAGDVFSEIGTGFAVIPLIGLLETIAIGKAFARQNDYRLDSNQELVAVGAANIVSSFVSSYPVTGSFSRTAVNSQSGVRTPAGGIWTGALVLLALGVLMPLFYYIPDAALGAVIITAVLQMVDYKIVKTLWQVKKADLVPLFFTFKLSFILGIEYGIMIGVGISLCMVLYPTARPTITRTNDQIIVFQPNQGLLFPGVEYLKDKVTNAAILTDVPKSVVIDCSYLSVIDFSGVQMVEKMYETFKLHKVLLVFSNMSPAVMDVVKRADIDEFKYSDTVDGACQIIIGSSPDKLNIQVVGANGYTGPGVDTTDETVTPHTSMSVLV